MSTAEALDKLTEAIVLVDRIARAEPVAYSDFGTNPRRHWAEKRSYTLKDAKAEASQTAALLRAAWQILDPI